MWYFYESVVTFVHLILNVLIVTDGLCRCLSFPTECLREDSMGEDDAIRFSASRSGTNTNKYASEILILNPYARVGKGCEKK